MATRIIGIDFGTSTTVVRVHNIGSDTEIIPVMVNGAKTIPTVAFQLESNGSWYYGHDAMAKIAAGDTGELYRNFKMNLISADEELRMKTEIIIQGFLNYVYDQYLFLVNNKAFETADDIRVYVSHPAKWNSTARSVMKTCVAKAGFCNEDSIFLKDEPTAAILAVMHEKNEQLKRDGMLFNNQEYKAMMIDMGAGTTDIVLCTYEVTGSKLQLDNIFTYPSIKNPGLCGGREIDDALVAAADEFVSNMQYKPSASGQKAVDRLKKRIKTWKELTVSGVLKDNTVLPEPDEIAEFRDMMVEWGIPVKNESERFNVSRDIFEDLTLTHWQQWASLLTGAFEEVNDEQYSSLNCPKSPEEVDLLIITGGHSQWYIVTEYLSGQLMTMNLPNMNFSKIRSNPNCLLQSKDPQETVAVGLCYLDEDIVGTLAAASTYSITFSCGNKYMGSCDLIKKGVPLPYEKTDFLITNTVSGNFIFRKEFTITYTVVSDGVNSVSKSIVIPSTGVIATAFRAALAAIGIAVWDLPRLAWHLVSGTLDELDDTVIEDIMNTQYKVNISPDISVSDEGIIKITGTIEIDGEKQTIPQIII